MARLLLNTLFPDISYYRYYQNQKIFLNNGLFRLAINNIIYIYFIFNLIFKINLHFLNYKAY